MREWRIGSLFAGIGGLEAGLEAAGLGRTAVQVEQDEFARGVLAKWWPEAKRYEDVRDVGAAELGGLEVLCGGFPCQDISQAGKGAGIDGTRSGLWAEFARIIGEVRPEVVVVENVSRLLALGMGRVLGDLAALGYDAEWDCIPAASVGAPHRRDRLFIVAYPHGSRYLDGESRIFPAEPRFPAQRESGPSGPLVAYAEGVGERPGPAGPGGHGEGPVLLEGAGQGRDPINGGRSRELADAGSERREGSEVARQRAGGWHGLGPGGAPVADAPGGRGSSQGLRPGRPEPRRGGPQELADTGFGGLQAEPPVQAGQHHFEGRRGSGRWLPRRESWATEPDVGRVAHGIPDRVHRLRCLGNAVVPQVAEYVGGLIMNALRDVEERA